MRRTLSTVLAAVSIAVAMTALAGCTAAPAPEPEPGPRVLIESQVFAFVDRVVALDPDNPTLTRIRRQSQDFIEEQGRRVCSHMIAGVPIEEAHFAAYPGDRSNPERHDPQSEGQQIVRIAAEVLCPTT